MNTQPASKDDPAISPFARRAAAVCDRIASIPSLGWIAIIAVAVILMFGLSGQEAADAVRRQSLPRVFLNGTVTQFFSDGFVVRKTPDTMPTTSASRIASMGGGGPSRTFAGSFSEGPSIYYVCGYPKQGALGIGDTIAITAVRDGSKELKAGEQWQQVARYFWMAEGDRTGK
jgi:hypothetical protein